MSTMKKCQVVMLPTNQKANLYLSPMDILKYSKDEDVLGYEGIKPKHLYILSNEEIKEGNWYVNKGVLFKADDEFNEGNNPNQNKQNKKIIATTDESLSEEYAITIANNSDFEIGSSGWINLKLSNLLPQPSQSFIEKYVEEYNKGNVIKEVMIEYELDQFTAFATIGKTVNYILKVNRKDNTITIKKVKDSWSREEVENIISKLIIELSTHIYTNKNQISNFDSDKWIEENL